MQDKQFFPVSDDSKNINIIHREEPTTAGQKFDNWMQDWWNRVIKKYWWFWLLLIGIPLFVVLLYFLTSTTDWRMGVQAAFQWLGSFIVSTFGLIFNSIGAGIVAFILTYFLAKRLLHREYIMFEEFDGEAMPILSMRKTSDEIILYKNRKGWLDTLIKGKIKIHIDAATFSSFEAVGEKKLITVDNEKYEVFRVYIMPQKELPDQEKFIKIKGQWHFNPLFNMDKADIEEYILKSNLPGVNPDKLRKTLVNLTIKNNQNRQRIAEIEKETDFEIESRFWDYLARQTPDDSFGKQIVRKKHKELLKSKPSDPDLLRAKEYDEHVQRSYKNVLGEYTDE